jgi:hypothetical protein
LENNVLGDASPKRPVKASPIREAIVSEVFSFVIYPPPDDG